MFDKKQYGKEWYKKNKEKSNKSSLVYSRTSKGKVTKRREALRRKYGISLEEYNEILELQHGVCAICGQPEIGRSLAIDHSHKTNKIRGLLCMACNVILGHIEKNPQLISEMKKYLEED